MTTLESAETDLQRGRNSIISKRRNTGALQKRKRVKYAWHDGYVLECGAAAPLFRKAYASPLFASCAYGSAKIADEMLVFALAGGFVRLAKER